MALVNYSLPFGGIGQTNWATISPLQPHHPTAVNNLLYGPAGHQETDQTAGVDQSHYYKNNPYAPPQSAVQFRPRTNNNYLPPPPPPRQFTAQNGQSQSPQQQQQQQQQAQQSRGVYQQPQQQIPQTTRTYGEGSYSQIPPRTVNQQQQQQAQQQYFNSYGNQQLRTYTAQPQTVTPQPQTQPSQRGKPLSGESNLSGSQNAAGNSNGKSNTGSADGTRTSAYPERAPGFTRVQAGQGSRTQVHAVLDYDDDNDDYYDDDDEGSPAEMPGGSKGTMPTVTPIQGPIFLKNGTVPVVPLFAYPTINNGTFVQIPIWWTALSVALGIDIRGDIIRGVPCVKRHHQLFCPTAGNTYPIERIERFIDDNKALMRRMYGDFEMVAQYGPPLQQTKKRKRNAEGVDVDAPGVPDLIGPMGAGPDPIREAGPTGDSYFGKWRSKRQNNNSQGGFSRAGGPPPATSSSRPSQLPPPRAQNLPQGGDPDNSGKIDTCESKIEIVTPYWASNSAGKIRAIVNTQHFEQAIHQEVCTKQNTGRCSDDCSCEQKYKWHRLLAYDPDNDCKGIFMDWFLFPSCCVCRCAP